MKVASIRDKNVQLLDLLVLLMVVSAVVGCAERVVPVEERSVPLTIALTGPLTSGQEGIMPDDIIKELCLPMHDDRCSSVAFVPQVRLMRLDSQEPKELPLDIRPPTGLREKIRRLYIRNPTMPQLMRARKASLKSLQFPDELYTEKVMTKPVDKDVLKSYISRSGAKHVFVLTTKDRTDSWSRLRDIKVTTGINAGELSNRIASYLCKEVPTDKTPLPKILMVYENKKIALATEDEKPDQLKACQEPVQCLEHLNQGMTYASLAKLSPATALENYENAQREFARAKELCPNCAVAHSNLGVVYMQQKKLDMAEIELRRATELDPTDPKAHYNLAAFYSLQNQLDPALAELDKALKCGFKECEILNSDRDLTNLRRHPRFREVLGRYGVCIGAA